MIFEGAQGALLDIDHGTYPFVTSSNPIAARPASAPASGRRTSTRSGGSRRPTRRASARGRSRPSSTTSWASSCARAAASSARRPGRSRRVGWLDLVALRYAARINALTALVVTKLDVLDRARHDQGLHALPRRGRRRVRPLPVSPDVLHHTSGEYVELPGWSEDIGEARSEDDLPENARRYLAFVEEFVGVPVGLIGVGPAAIRRCGRTPGARRLPRPGRRRSVSQRQRSTRSSSGTSRTTRAGDAHDDRASRHVALDDRAGRDERLLTDLDAGVRARRHRRSGRHGAGSHRAAGRQARSRPSYRRSSSSHTARRTHRPRRRRTR